MIEVIENWTATRSGAFMTIVGERNGAAVRLPGIVKIEGGTPWPIATDRNGNRYELDASDLRNAAELAA